MQDVKHHVALPVADAPGVYRLLSEKSEVTAKLLQVIMLTALRFSEAAKARCVDFHREVTRAGARFPLRIDPCETLPLAGIVGGYRSDRHGVFDYYPALGTA
ncbi:MAG: hypothetical protein WA975_05615 [Mesorhizobium sp.]